MDTRAPKLDSVLVSEGPETNRTLNDTQPDWIPMGQRQVEAGGKHGVGVDEAAKVAGKASSEGELLDRRSGA